ncbi:cation transport protein-domain-containing protein [Irpex rosettiformis]|uniref:Cation transport protein-domain-containing protein n=1 Tax=Irpex rosettiformis TaxID=378272 RepID=A0ACB8U948_9APHY|nr:cation transport protein-domain-containing protein [Irpex rosettiformis]
MPPRPSSTRTTWHDLLSRWRHYARTHLNFYRIHILFFTFTPLIFSGIFYASNGSTKVSYIDSLFNCVSAITVCGLATIDLSSLTPWQQVILFLQMCVGSPVVVSWVMVFVRREIFASKFRYVLNAEIARRVEQKVHAPVEVIVLPWWKRAARVLTTRKLSTIEEVPSNAENTQAEHPSRGRSTAPRVRLDMIRRMDDAPKLINPSGKISEHQDGLVRGEQGVSSTAASISEATEAEIAGALRKLESDDNIAREKNLQDANANLTDSTEDGTGPLVNRFKGRHGGEMLPRTQTIEFAPTPRRGRDTEHTPGEFLSSQSTHPVDSPVARTTTIPRTFTIPHTNTMPRISTIQRTSTFPRTDTIVTYRSQRTKHRGFGGFPMPLEIISRLFNWFFPSLGRGVTRTVTMPRTQTITSQNAANFTPGARPVSYITFEAIVGRNSDFQELTREQLEELGGVEYRGLSALLWIYHIGTQLIAFIVIAPYMSIPRWHEDFVPPNVHKYVAPAWFSLFQVVSAYTNTGMSLEDQSMIPFQNAYPMIVFMIFLILAGNTAFPIFLRFLIWLLTMIVPKGSRLKETLHFLLDHPRRCFIYLFPSHQTWFLLTVVFLLTLTDWFFFLVLDIGNPAIQNIPTGVRVLLGALQATAVRASGFGTVVLSALAPAVKVLYVVMMYISVYPIAMSVRSTNVYEEKSLGVFEDDVSIDEENFRPEGPRATIWSRYLAMHMRRQLSFDMWWLALALFLVCIIERDNLENPEFATWFNIFVILFELVSAYGSVGLSLGVPYANYSFSGALKPLSKLIVCLVMLRGRHRGLPVAIDRAVILPFEFRDHDEDPDEDPNGEGADMSLRRTSTQRSRRSQRRRPFVEKSPSRTLNRRSWQSSSSESQNAQRSSEAKV